MNTAEQTVPENLPTVNLSPEFIARFWEKVDKNGPIPPHKPELGQCWVWKRSKNKQGYGTLKNEISTLAHRVSYVMSFGHIPVETPCVLHHCDNPSCVRMSHLWAGTNLENMQDMIKKGRDCKSSGDTHYSKLFPEKMAHGIKNGTHTHPEKLAWGDKNWTRKFPELVLRGSSHAMAKLTEEQVVSIRKRYAAGDITLSKLGNEFGVTFGLIGHIVKRRIWKHV